jgi:alpha-beta hydrolase superfamily lysophospholipase
MEVDVEGAATAITPSTGTNYYAGEAGRIHYRWWTAPNPKWLILLAHGFGDHSNRWERFGLRLAGQDGAVFACDHRGHGLSDGDRAVVEDFDEVARDFLRLLESPELPQGLPVILAGHSMGGLIVTRAAVVGGADLAGLVVSGARIGGWEVAETLLERIERGEVDPKEGAGHPLLDPNAPLKLDALSRDPAIAEMFLADDLTYKGPWPLETLRAYVRATADLKEREGVLDSPILYMHGGADPITPPRQSVDRIMQLAAGDIEVRIFEGARHSIYNEINRDEVYDVLVRFIHRVAN